MSIPFVVFDTDFNEMEGETQSDHFFVEINLHSFIFPLYNII